MIEEDDPRGSNVSSWKMDSADQWCDYVAGNHDEGDSLIFADGHLEYWRWQDPDTLTLPYFNEGSSFHGADPGSVDLARLWEVFRPR